MTKKQIAKIFDNIIDELQQRLVQKGLSLVISPSVKRDLIKKGYSEKYGARPLRRVIQDELEHKIADGILSGAYEKGSVLNITMQNKEIKVDVISEI